ncbi:MAG TPA: hypothetical protein VNS32_16255 [Flavisolibacter sp.]|nr:hypothetical protein [Flavisolibacter sp.]
MEAKGGKEMEINYLEEKPDVISIIIRNNRGTEKDVLEVKASEFINQVSLIGKLHSLFKDEN